MSLRRDMISLMQSEGFKIERQSGKHYIWSDGTVVITTARSPSDYRAIANTRARIKRERNKINDAILENIGQDPSKEIKVMADYSSGKPEISEDAIDVLISSYRKAVSKVKEENMVKLEPKEQENQTITERWKPEEILRFRAKALPKEGEEMLIALSQDTNRRLTTIHYDKSTNYSYFDGEKHHILLSGVFRYLYENKYIIRTQDTGNKNVPASVRTWWTLTNECREKGKIKTQEILNEFNDPKPIAETTYIPATIQEHMILDTARELGMDVLK